MFYHIYDNNIYLLINTEIRNGKKVYNSIGGKVDYNDKNIFDTMKREFNEETGYLVSDKIKTLKYNPKNNISFTKSKYLLNVNKINFDIRWKYLCYNYSKIFCNIEQFNH